MRRSKYLSKLLVALLVAACVLSACSGQGEKIKLSEMDDNALIAYLEGEEVTAPEDIGIETIRAMIIRLEENPDSVVAVSLKGMFELNEDLRKVVKDYYGIIG